MFLSKKCSIFILAAATISGCHSVSTVDNKSWKENFESGYASTKKQDYAAAEENYRAALRIAEDFPKGDARLPKTLTELGSVYIAENKPDEATRVFTRAHSLYEELWKPGDTGVDNRDFALGLSMTSLRLANLSRDALQFDRADNFYKKALEVEEAALGSEDFKRQIIEGRANLLTLMGRGGEATRLLQSIEEIKPIASVSEQDKNNWRAVEDAADEAFQGGDMTKATALYQSAIKIAQTNGNADHQSESLRKLATIHDIRGEFATALELLQQAQEVLPKNERGTAKAEVLISQGFVYGHDKKYDQSEVALKEAIKLCDAINDKEALKKEKPALEGLTRFFSEQANYAQAEKYASRNLELDQQLGYINGDAVEQDLTKLGEIEAKEKKNASAQKHFAEAVAMLEKKRRFNPKNLLNALELYAKLLRDTKQDALAETIEMKAKNVRSEFE